MRRAEYIAQQQRKARRKTTPRPPTYREMRALRFPTYTGWDGSQLWRELHNETIPTPETVERVIARVCRFCLSRAYALRLKLPPRFDSLEEYRRWTVEFHDAVNAEVGNALVGWDAARKLYGW